MVNALLRFFISLALSLLIFFLTCYLEQYLSKRNIESGKLYSLWEVLLAVVFPLSLLFPLYYFINYFTLLIKWLF